MITKHVSVVTDQRSFRFDFAVGESKLPTSKSFCEAFVQILVLSNVKTLASLFDNFLLFLCAAAEA